VSQLLLTRIITHSLTLQLE